MSTHIARAVLVLTFAWSMVLSADEKPYITTKNEITLLSANDGETDPSWRTTGDGLTDYKVKTKDSFTVIRLGPDHPPVCRTVSGTVPCSILGTPRMAMSSDGHFGLITNHGGRLDASYPLKYPVASRSRMTILRNAISRSRTWLRPGQHALDDRFGVSGLSGRRPRPVRRLSQLVLAHPDRQHFVVGAPSTSTSIGSREANLSKSVEPTRQRVIRNLTSTPQEIGSSLPKATGQLQVSCPSSVGILSAPTRLAHLIEVTILEGVDTMTPDSYILRISRDGKKRSFPKIQWVQKAASATFLSRTSRRIRPSSTRVIKQVSDGVESFAFHPNGKMAVASCLSKFNNNIAVLDIDQIRREFCTTSTRVGAARESSSLPKEISCSSVFPCEPH